MSGRDRRTQRIETHGAAPALSRVTFCGQGCASPRTEMKKEESDNVPH